jgi:hypothetical protein
MDMDTTNEPVAWMELYKDSPNNLYWEWDDCKVKGYWRAVPLYAHPSEHDLGIAEAIGFDRGYKAATVKELTDEEINEIFGKTWLDFQDYKEFARAILRKAQEK